MPEAEPEAEDGLADNLRTYDLKTRCNASCFSAGADGTDLCSDQVTWYLKGKICGVSETAIGLYEQDVIAEFSGLVGNACVLAVMYLWFALTIRNISASMSMSELREVFRNAIDLNRYSNGVSRD